MPYPDRELGDLEVRFIADIQKRLRHFPISGWTEESEVFASRLENCKDSMLVTAMTILHHSMLLGGTARTASVDAVFYAKYFVREVGALSGVNGEFSDDLFDALLRTQNNDEAVRTTTDSALITDLNRYLSKVTGRPTHSWWLWVDTVEKHADSRLPAPKATVIKPPPAFPYKPKSVRSY